MKRIAGLIIVAALGACSTTASTKAPAPAETAKPLAAGLDPAADRDPFPSTYRPMPSQPTAIVGATVLTGTGQQLEGATVLLADGKVTAVGVGLAVPAGAVTVEGRGKWVTPGLIDAHSHLGAGPSPNAASRSDINEAVDPNTARVWVEHSVWPQDPGFDRARQGGVTSLMILPGSANLFGGRSATLKNVPALSVMGMKFPGAPYGLKMACGENPKRVYGGRQRSPATAMGNVAGYRQGWIEAANYARTWEAWRVKAARPPSGDGKPSDPPDPPKRDLQLDTMVGVLRGEILVQNHCYRADEMAVMLDIAKEFGYRITTFHHASEGYKIADRLAADGVCIATWADWAGFKLESYDGIAENAPLVHRAGGCAVIHSDDETIIQHLNQEAAIAMAAGNRAGLNITRAEAIAWVTSNAARAIGVGDRTGSLEPGKMADVVVWSGDPFSVYSRAEKVYIDGALTYDRTDPRFQPRSDFELGQPGQPPRPIPTTEARP